VSNTGLALHRLGVPTRLLGKLGDDLLGRLLLEFLRSHDPRLAESMIVAPGEPTSYTVVFNTPEGDRGFLHCSGANDTFHPDELDFSTLAGSALFHFGYPPIMRRMYQDGGAETVALFQRAKSLGCTTSLDMACPDPRSEAGHVDWDAFLRAVLPHVDLFTPSYEDLRVLLGANTPPADRLADCDQLAGKFLAYGVAAVVIKLGSNGLYLRTTPHMARWQSVGRAMTGDAAAWTGRVLLAPCFDVTVKGTTGAGDVTGAGFLAAFGRGCSPEEALVAATAAGASGVEQADATSGVPPWNQMWQRVQAGWPQREPALGLGGWSRNPESGLYAGAEDSIA
jgi:sugar/nucleoside kinase (ribokinase family)